MDPNGGYAESAVWSGLQVKNVTKPPEPGSISGRVVDDITGSGIPQATIYYSPTLTNFIKLKTDSKGLFAIEGLKGGEYHIYATASGYDIGAIIDVEVEYDKTTEVKITLHRMESPDAENYKVKISTHAKKT